jgi:hypothetical protein
MHKWAKAQVINEAKLWPNKQASDAHTCSDIL